MSLFGPGEQGEYFVSRFLDGPSGDIENDDAEMFHYTRSVLDFS